MTMLQFVVTLKALVEVAMFAFIGQGALWILAGPKREGNWVYGILKMLTKPAFKVARWISPRFILDQHLWLVVLFLLVVTWAALTVWKVSLILRP